MHDRHVQFLCSHLCRTKLEHGEVGQAARERLKLKRDGYSMCGRKRKMIDDYSRLDASADIPDPDGHGRRPGELRNACLITLGTVRPERGRKAVASVRTADARPEIFVLPE